MGVSKNLPTAALLLAAWPALAQEPLPAGIADAIRLDYGDGELRYFDRAVDLNGDGKPEIVVYLVGPAACGSGGCNLLVYTPSASGYRRVGDLSVTRAPIRAAAAASSSGWRNLIVHVGGGGKSGDVELAFDGRSYPDNPTVPGPRAKPAVLEGSELLIDDFASIEDAKRLSATAMEPAPAQAEADAGPSFDCAKARTAVEQRVCGDAGLSALDRALADAYAKGLAPESGWPERDKQASRAAQKAWLGERDRCAKASDPRGCVASAYQRRITTLRIQNGDMGVVPSAVAYRCPGIEGQPVTAVFYNEAVPSAAVITVGDRQAVAFAAPSGSGAKYAASGVEFWEHRGEATLRWSGKTYACQAR
jgi:uncharacterized protein